MEKFIEQILKNLENNGFPHKRVSLPTEKMYEIADNKGLSLNKALDGLKAKHNITSEIGADKIVFSKEVAMSQEDMYAQAQEMMSKMSPEEMQRMQEMVMNMSPEQKEELMQKGKDMGLI